MKYWQENFCIFLLRVSLKIQMVVSVKVIVLDKTGGAHVEHPAPGIWRPALTALNVANLEAEATIEISHKCHDSLDVDSVLNATGI